MLVNDPADNNRIIDYDISFDDESKKTVLEILDDSFSKRQISLPFEEMFLLHKGFTLSDLKSILDSNPNKFKGSLRDLTIYYYIFGNKVPKRSAIGNIRLGEEINVSRTEIYCSLSSTINFILHHLNKEECSSFMSKFSKMEKVYIERLLSFSGYERLTVLLGTIVDTNSFLKRCQNFEISMQLEDLKLLEKIRYFKMVYNLATLTASKFYDRAYLNSISYMGDEMEREEIQDIQDASAENTEMIKMLKLEPKRVIL